MSRADRRVQGRALGKVFEAMDEDMQTMILCVVDSLVHQHPFAVAFDGDKASCSFGAGPRAMEFAVRMRALLCAELDAANVPRVAGSRPPDGTPLQ